MRREPFIRRITPDETGRVLDPRRVRRFYLLMLPVLAPILTLAAGAVIIWGLDIRDAELIGGIVFAVGFLLLIAYCVFETCYLSHYPSRCYLRWLRERIDRRPDAVVKADDPDAFYVQIIPRENWGISMGENAGDMGLLRVDPARGELRYEGDLERWVVPAESIVSFRLQSFTPPDAAGGDDPVLGRGPAGGPGRRRRPVGDAAGRPAGPLRGVVAGQAEARAELLRRCIANLVNPERFRPVDDEELWPLRPPAGH